ncbi:hypothetical protein BKA03_001332 [Demequina lutea]|uniref:SseB protein N-terminal domain-containing protein n=2 Tax=Demequina lutea TaxID=431489 RepID=A0A7Y9ZBP4_9MICO|nr:hypothetical protein [Demequina lutea]
MPENERLNALISAGVRGDVTIWDVATELINSVIYLGSSTAGVKGLADAKPLFLKMGTSDCVVVCISRAASAKFVEQTPYFIALRADSFISQLQPNLGLYVEGDADAFILHPPEIARIKAVLAAQRPPE